jgi:hypothetical protein
VIPIRTGWHAVVYCALALSVGAFLAPTAPARTVAAAPPPRVTLIGDSIAAAIAYVQDARTVLGQGVDLRLEVTPCRRVAQESCPYNGVRPPTVIDLVHSLGDALGQTVIVAVGYNDFEAAYAGNIEDALDALHAAHVTRVIWPTLRAERHSYVDMNDDIRAAAAKHPEVTVADWNVYSRSHPDWFQPDGLHLGADGATAMATLLHDTLAGLGIPVATPPPSPAPGHVAIVSSALRAGHVGQAYAATLVARGGTKPYHWRRAVGRLPSGLRLLAGGRLAGVPHAAGTFEPVVRVTDAHGVSATRRVILRIRG